MTMLATCSTGCANVTPAFSSRSSSSRQQPKCCRRQALVTRATLSDEPQQVVSRRAVSLTGLGALLLSVGGPAQAGLLDAKQDKNEIYTADTSLLLEKVKNGLDLPKDASNREEVFQDIKEKTTAWVAKYRRGAAFQGRPSYNTTYSAVNALAGHFNSFGLTAPVPKKRLDRIQKELTDADRALKRGR